MAGEVAGLVAKQHVELIEKARVDSRVVLTFDLDFGEILALGVVDRPSVVNFPLANERPALA